MASLDNLSEIKKLDAENILSNIQEFPDQLERCWNDWQNIPLPTSFVQAKNVVIGGMGGSGIGGALVKSLAVESSIPITLWNDYGVPGYLNKDSLVIVVSYSGNTEETVDFLQKASKISQKIVTISTGGKIASLATNYRTPHYKIDYGSEPRAALGYLFTSVLAVVSKLGIYKVSDEDFKESVIILRGLQKKIDVNVSSGANHAKVFAQKLAGKIPIVYGSGNLSEVARRWKGEFNENSKTASYYEIIPELNHNALVGLQFPKDLREKIFIIILQSKYDHPRNRLRQSVTAQILDRNRIKYDFLMIEPSPSPLGEIIQVIHFGDYVSFYLAMLNNVEPNPVTIIQYLKDKLAEKPM